MRIFEPSNGPHQSHIETLTSLRFLAALWVLMLHFTNELGFRHESYTQFIHQGKLGVDFFFVLSGFIMAHVYLAAMAAGRFSFIDFIKKRFARLYPIHLATFLFVAAYVCFGMLIGVRPGEAEAYQWSSVIPNLLMIHAWGVEDRLSFNYVSWSISAEWFAYLTFWPLALLTLRLSPVQMLAATATLFFVLYALSETLFGRQLTFLTFDFGIARILPEFLVGVALYRLSCNWDLGTAGKWLTVALVAVVAIVAHFGLGDWLAVPILAFLIFAVASLERQGGVHWLRTRPLIYLGEISYSIYMVHGIVLTLWFKALGMTLGAQSNLAYALSWLAIPLSLVTAAAAYHAVETPSRRFLNRHLAALNLRSLMMRPLSPHEPASRPSR
ncbi:MAG: acyltransferase [Pseudomonadota bacterium]